MAQVTQQPLWGWRERSDRSPQRGGRLPDLQRSLISQALMGTLPVIPVQPALDLDPGFAQDVKQFGVEQLIPQRAVEALQVPVVVAFWITSPNPILTTTLWTPGTCMGFL